MVSSFMALPLLISDTARKLIEKELKMPSWRGGVDAIFSEFPEQPIAAASLGQVSKPCSDIHIKCFTG